MATVNLQRESSTNNYNIILLHGLVYDIDNGDKGNAVTHYFYIPWGTEGMKFGSIDYTLEATTMTIEGTNDSPQIVDADANWRDLTDVFFGGLSSVTTSGTLTIDKDIAWGRLRLVFLTTNATNAAEVRITKAN